MICEFPVASTWIHDRRPRPRGSRSLSSAMRAYKTKNAEGREERERPHKRQEDWTPGGRPCRTWGLFLSHEPPSIVKDYKAVVVFCDYWEAKLLEYYVFVSKCVIIYEIESQSLSLSVCLSPPTPPPCSIDFRFSPPAHLHQHEKTQTGWNSGVKTKEFTSCTSGLSKLFRIKTFSSSRLVNRCPTFSTEFFAPPEVPIQYL